MVRLHDLHRRCTRLHDLHDRGPPLARPEPVRPPFTARLHLVSAAATPPPRMAATTRARRMSSLDISSSFSGLEKGGATTSGSSGWVESVEEETVVSAAGRSSGRVRGAGPRSSTSAVVTKAVSYDPDLLWYVHGQAYDLKDFVKTHPGGSDALALVRGRDCTALFESYHPFTDRPRAILAKHRVKDVPASVLRDKVVDTSGSGWFHRADGSDDPFWKELRARCGAYMREHNVSPHMAWPAFVFGLLTIALQVWLYVCGYLRGCRVSAVALGVVSWVLAGTFGHEGLHWGVSGRAWVNRAVAYWSIAGIANPVVWQDQHTYGHHSFTNDFNMDPDVHHFEAILRMHLRNPHSVLHRLLSYRVWVYLWWSQTVFGECVLLPLKTLATGYVQNSTKVVDRSLAHRGLLLLHTLCFFGVLVLAPWAVLSGYDAAVLFACYHFTAGLCFGAFSQVNHLNQASIVAAYKPTSWAVQQVETAANFCEHSTFWFIFSGGLNFQIEHHLFPGLSHAVLPLLTPIIKDTCRDFGVEYKTYPTFPGILDEVHRYFQGLAHDSTTTTTQQAATAPPPGPSPPAADGTTTEDDYASPLLPSLLRPGLVYLPPASPPPACPPPSPAGPPSTQNKKHT